MPKPVLLHLGDDVQWNRDLYNKLQERFNIMRSYSMNREDFKNALSHNRFGDFAAIYRPFWNTGGEMGAWDEEFISLLPRSCKIYASAGAGFDWVDTQRLARRGIIYCNSAPACTESVADTAIWLILNAFRNFTWSSSAARSLDPGKFREAHQDIAATTHNPNGFSLGIIGLGKIGYRIAQKAHVAFEMKIIYNDVNRLPESVEKGVSAQYYENLDDMLADSDCVLLATPFVGEKVMNAERFAKMKRGSRFVNIARGKLVDEVSLLAALKSGHLAFAGLDVHYDEPNVNPDLARLPQVELLSHTAGASLESHMGFEKIGLQNILSFFDTGKAITPVNLQWLSQPKL
ncbi:D-isomer specific 2-hydroxyacid dehydrogenase [Tothia fuscella]|uniref:D-isomer specific 2-hydroxyacid dehydrogenase n=1 Tax=Tothia fuscella TaxID=1048955 RepID=A0A9P4NRL7_9PEZI|nr:D-isomer specific 2-hydroxyacid dehydrogenase [Tothia fuscella]